MTLKKILAFTSGMAASCLAYGTFIEPLDFRIRTARMPILPKGSRPSLVLHISDAHLLMRQRAKLEFLRMLELLEPDLVITTGDNIAEADAILPYVNALGGLFEAPGVFVFGGNDYHGPRPMNPLSYIWKTSSDKAKRSGVALPWQELESAFSDRGWINVMERKIELEINGVPLEIRGTSDAHIGLDNYDKVAGAVAPGHIGIGVTHAPYKRVLEPMVTDGLSAIFAGHTHGGQVRIPGVGALTTNCDLPLSQAKGLSTVSHRGRRAYLHVSAGLGASPKTPFRFANPPEVTLITLMPSNLIEL